MSLSVARPLPPAEGPARPFLPLGRLQSGDGQTVPSAGQSPAEPGPTESPHLVQVSPGSSHCFPGLSTQRFKAQHHYTSQVALDSFPGPGSPVPHRQGDVSALVQGWGVQWGVGRAP